MNRKKITKITSAIACTTVMSFSSTLCYGAEGSSQNQGGNKTTDRHDENEIRKIKNGVRKLRRFE